MSETMVPKIIYTGGCLDKFEELIVANVAVVGGVGIGIAFVQVRIIYFNYNFRLFYASNKTNSDDPMSIRILIIVLFTFQFIGIVFACILARTIKKEYETV